MESSSPTGKGDTGSPRSSQGPIRARAGGRERRICIFDVTGHTDRPVTQVFFAGEPLNAEDRIFQQVPRNREGLIVEILPAPAGEDPSTRLVQWNVVLPRG
jgi:hypothetical protein